MARLVLPGVPALGHITGGGFWHAGRPDGCAKCSPPEPLVRSLTMRDVEGCPRRILSPRHYRADGSCRCADTTTEERP